MADLLIDAVLLRERLAAIGLFIELLEVLLVHLADGSASACIGHWEAHLLPDSLPTAVHSDRVGAASTDNYLQQLLEVDLLAVDHRKFGECDAFSLVELDYNVLEGHLPRRRRPEGGDILLDRQSTHRCLDVFVSLFIARR